MVKGILLDIGGVLHEGGEVVPGAIEAVERLRRSYQLRFLSNSSRIPPQKLLEQLRAMGFSIGEEELFTALSAAKLFLEQQRSSAFVVATDEAADYFSDLDYPERYLLICDAYTNFTYQRLNEAFRKLEEGYGFLATNVNRYFRDRDGLLSLDAGGFVKGLEYASGRSAKVLGKPNCEFFALAIRSMGVAKEEVIMVGDDIEGDIVGAKSCWLKTVLVKTGKFREHDLLKAKPDLLIESIAQLPDRLEEMGD
ncbi:MAG: TIGR01458 family HAD-type hydrolase [Epsilonproteobacteria bacterium]|nr:TIGR01458 family HAD-type hydrolase [Campylobacterota bacterium]NPA57099.1 TIGR01458 family HAD-type hydrolase [Campylobacterota bacterium]